MATADIQVVSHPAQVLVLEDEYYLGKGLQMVLADEGYGADLSLTGLKALEALRRKSFDLLVADLRLPDMDGMEVVQTAKQSLPGVEVIVITGYPSASSAVSAFKAGAFEYLRKPFTEDEFKVAVRGALKHRLEVLPGGRLDRTDRRVIEKQEVVRVLQTSLEDPSFWLALLERGSQVLEGRALSPQARAAIVSGDLKWLNEHVGELSETQLSWVYARLEQERW
ncbi:MAG: response regulator [bacterium]